MRNNIRLELMYMTKLIKQIKLQTLIVLALLVALLVLGLVYLSIDWSGAGLGQALKDGLTNLGEVFDFTKWSSISNGYTTVAYMLTISVTLIGVIITAFWLYFAIIRSEIKYGITGAILNSIVTFFIAFFVASLIHQFNTSIVNGGVLAIIVYIFLILTLLAQAWLFVLSVKYLFFPYQKGTVVGDEVVLEQTTVLETETTEITENAENTTIIINNYNYGETVQEESAPIIIPVAEVVEIESNKRAPRKPFALKLQGAEQSVRDIYNELKAEFISYGLKSRISVAGDTFRLHTVTYAQVQISGQNFKIYFALDPRDFVDSTYPITDVSKQKVFEETPVCLKVRSGLSIRRAKELIERVCEKNGVIQEENPEVLDYSKETIETLNDSKYYQEKFLDN